jgi:hypothetical protein
MSTQPIYNGDTLVLLGDSIVTQGVFNDALAAIAAAFVASPTIGRSSATGGIATATGGVGQSQPIVGSIHVFNLAVSGTGIATIDATFAARVAALVPLPDDIWIHTGVNNLPSNPEALSLAAYSAAWASVIAQAVALPNHPRIWIDSILCQSELWLAGPLRWAGPHDAPAVPSINDFNAAAIAALGAAGLYVDARAAYLALEPTGNPGSAPDGYLITPGAYPVHPNATGQAVVSAQMMAHVTVVP